MSCQRLVQAPKQNSRYPVSKPRNRSARAAGEPVDPLEAAKQTMCPLKKYDERTLGGWSSPDPGFEMDGD